MHRSIFARRIAPSLAVLLVLSALCAPAGSRAQRYPSARIESLGGDAVSGVIPDTLTDIHLNPAYLSRCRRITINYGQRETDAYSMRFPILQNRIPGRVSISPHRETELSIYGIPAGSWRMGVSAGWYLDYRDYSNPGHDIYYGPSQFREEYSIFANHYDYHNYRIDISASRKLAPGAALGVRGGGFQRIHSYWTTHQRKQYDFRIEEPDGEIFFQSESYNYDKSDDSWRVSSLFLQAGLLAGEGRGGRSVLFQVTRSEIYGRSLDRRVYTRTQYDQFGEVEEYSFDDEYYRDERAGVLWTYDIKGRFSLPDGTRIFAGGGLERMRYDTSWLDSYMTLDWRDTWIDSDEGVSVAFDDEGDYDGFHLFLKAGRTTELMSNLRLTAGVHGFVRWTRSRERQIAATELYSRVDSSLITFSIERPIDISIETTEAGLNLPLAVEYEPAPWISIWSGFRIYTTYGKEKDNLPITSAIDLINFLDPSMVASYLSQESPRSVEDVEVGSTATFGLSLHYRDRFFVDLYTGPDVTPDYLTNYILDVRYAF